MNNDENRPTDLAEHSIVRQARMLDKEMQPERDLWPGIADIIRGVPQLEFNQPNYVRWMPMAMAASLMIAIGALGFAGFTNYSLKQQSLTSVIDETTVNLIDQPFMIARTSYLTALVTDEQQMSSEVREVLKKNLKIIDDATQEIREALKENPNDPFLTDALLLTRQKELALLNQITNQGLDTI